MTKLDKKQSFTWKEGKWLEGNPPLLGPMSHAWWMASSVFDGARAFSRLAPDLDRHCARLIESGKAFQMKSPLTLDEMVTIAWDGIEKFPHDAELYIRPMMYFEEGFVTPDTDTTQFILTVFDAPLPAWTGLRTMISSYRRPTPDSAPTNAKASCLYPNVARALSEARTKGYDTAVVLDTLGNVAEFATNNLFIVKDGIVQTPIPNGTFLSGLTRGRVMELLTKDGYRIQERTLSVSDLKNAEEIFLTGNYSKIQPVVQIEKTKYDIGPVATRARELYFEFSAKEGKKNFNG